jgi:hypothetical protein
MKQHGAKKQPTRHDYALALKTIRAQFHTLEAQSGTIRRQNQFMVTVWKDDRTRGHRATSPGERLGRVMQRMGELSPRRSNPRLCARLNCH